jgi:phage terminase small subunit
MEGPLSAQRRRCRAIRRRSLHHPFADLAHRALPTDSFALGRDQTQVTTMMLSPKQARFVEEYLVDLDGKHAAIRAGYSPITAEVQASRLLTNVKVRVSLEAAVQARSKRTDVTADRVVAELARIAFANMRDYWPRPGEVIELDRLDQDRTAAISEITIDEFVDAAGVLHRRTRLKLHDKQAALVSLARHLGTFVDRRGHVSLEERIALMTPEERRARVFELLERGLQFLSPDELEQFKKIENQIEAEYEEAEHEEVEPPQKRRVAGRASADDNHAAWGGGGAPCLSPRP